MFELKIVFHVYGQVSDDWWSGPMYGWQKPTTITQKFKTLDACEKARDSFKSDPLYEYASQQREGDKKILYAACSDIG
jgi:hypothetical protein